MSIFLHQKLHISCINLNSDYFTLVALLNLFNVHFTAELKQVYCKLRNLFKNMAEGAVVSHMYFWYIPMSGEAIL